MNKWAHYMHVMLANDLIEHDNFHGPDCECKPEVKPDDLLIVHNALDNRELDEIADQINADL